MKLDKIDMTLLYELDQNSRKSLNAIAKEMRISRNMALYRINRLKELGIIKGTFTEVNNLALGYHILRMTLKLGNFTKRQRESLMKFILSQKSIAFFSEVLGKWDLYVVYITDDLYKFNEFRKDLLFNYNSIIEEINFSLLTQLYNYPKDYLINKTGIIRKKKTLKPKIKLALDDTDKLILKLLANNADINILDLAKKTSLSVNTVKKRLKLLERNNVILGYRLFIDTNKLGYNYYKLHLNLRNYTKKDFNDIFGFLESKNFVIYIDQYLSGEDLEVEMHLKTEKEYLDFITELNEKFGRIIKDHFMIRFYSEFAFKYLP